MSRKPGNPGRRPGRGFGGLLNQKSQLSPLFSVVLIVLGALFILGYFFHGSDSGIKEFNRIEGDYTCTAEVLRALPLLKKAYGDGMRRILHVGPESCVVVSTLLKEEETEAWGVEPYDIEDSDENCKSLVLKGLVRVADIKFALPYSAKSFSLVVVSDVVDYLSPKYLNRTLPELARVSSDGLVVFTGFPGQSHAKITESSKFGRPAKKRSQSWWVRFFAQTSLEENEAAIKKFEHAATQSSFSPKCQIFHLNSHH